MARPSPKRAPKEATRKNRKVCQFCKDKTEWIDYKDVKLLQKFVSERGKIRARRVMGNCVQHQRDIAVAVKTSRELALLPYSQRTTTERSGRPPRSDRRSSSGDQADEETSLASGSEDVAADAIEDTELVEDRIAESADISKDKAEV